VDFRCVCLKLRSVLIGLQQWLNTDIMCVSNVCVAVFGLMKTGSYWYRTRGVILSGNSATFKVLFFVKK
jgi:hypothetical protein